ncbi:MAG: tubulin-like doman-containing protein, partial [Pirellulaceae bacterium]
LSEEDRSVIGRALAKNPEDRFANCRELVNTLIHGGRPPIPDQGSGHAGAAKPSPSAFALPVAGALANEAKGDGAGGLGGVTEVRPIRVPDDMLRDAEIANQTAVLARDGRDAEAEASLRQSSVGFPQGRQRFSDDVRQSVVGNVEPDRSALWSAADQRREVTDLPPLEIDLSGWQPVPTFFVGLGGTAGRTLQRLRRKLDDRFGSQRGALFPMFFLETDHKDAMRATHGDDGAPLSAQEVLTIPLRKSQDYRAESNRHLEWLSRRWLYNIPRSQQTEGVRPLGRLALVDHADDVRRQLRAVLQSFLKSLAAERDAGQPAEVRIVVVGSISGATAGGAIADVGFLLRQLLDQQQATGEIMLVLTHSSCRQAAAQQLAQVNAYVTLAEWNECLK